MCPRSIADLPSSQALPGFLVTAPPSVCVPDVIGVLAVWIQNQQKKKLPSLGACRVLIYLIRACDLSACCMLKPSESPEAHIRRLQV